MGRLCCAKNAFNEGESGPNWMDESTVDQQHNAASLLQPELDIKSLLDAVPMQTPSATSMVSDASGSLADEVQRF